MCKLPHIFAVVAVVLLLGTLPTVAQEPLGKREEGVIGGGGPSVGWLFLEMTVLNTLLEANGFAPLPEGMLLMGGSGGGGLLTGFRFGGWGAGGELSSVQGDRVARLSLGLGGFLLSYALFSHAMYDAAVGLLIGGGGAELTLLDHHSASFEEAIRTPAHTVLERGFFLVQPQVSLVYRVLNWLSVKVSAGYMFTVGGSWVQEGRELPGPPADFNGWSVMVMAEFGGWDEED